MGTMFWRQRLVIGYRLLTESDRMVIFFEDGSIEELAKWSDCHSKLGIDWVLAMKKKMERDSGASIPVDVT